MSPDEASDVFYRALEGGHFRDLEERLRRAGACPPPELVDEFADRIAELLGCDRRSDWVFALLANGWCL